MRVGSEKEYEELLERMRKKGNVVNPVPVPTLPVKAGESIKKGKGPNKTELAAYHYLKID